MDVELVTEGISEDEILRLNDNIEDYTNLEGERCGICMDVVVDRGVLDCCQHWFCFTCIDNWATITNLCPLCQNEFQLITCVPVYDTLGSNRTDEDLYSRDEDWSIEGKNNSLSFPSYYIDENAVVCLDGDGCKIRSGAVTIETDSSLDTSIACDSCDIWYHAFCVGFDTEGACENSWLCPRCIVEQVPKESDDAPVSRPNNQHAADTTVNGDNSTESAFSSKLLVSVADAGETAVVVSFAEENLGKEIQGGLISNLVASVGAKIDTASASSATDDRKGELPNAESDKLELSLSQDTYSSLQLINTDDNTVKIVSSVNSSATPFNDKWIESGLDLHLGLSLRSSSDVDLINNLAEDQMPSCVDEKSFGDPLSANETMPNQEAMLTVSSMKPDEERNAAASSVAKRKHEDTSADDGETKAKIDSKISLKKVKVQGNSHLMNLKHKHTDSVADESKILSAGTDVTDSGSKSPYENKNETANIMDIVKETSRRHTEKVDYTNSATMSSTERENAAGLRVKKIMKRSGNDTDSSVLVQNLRKEIREAVRNRSSKDDIGENIFDPKLLAAFRAVVSGPFNEDKRPPLDVKAKKALLQKGKVRENLTKKIYGIGGRRKRAWTRDCEIEFWKHRCSKVSQPEKVQTLRLVLDLLQSDTDKTTVNHEREGDTTGSILSRLYLADTSVFPRKDDIKPVAALKNVAVPLLNEEHTAAQKSLRIPPKNEVSTKTVSPLSCSKLTKKSEIAVKGESVSSKLHQNKCREGPSISKADSSKSPSNQEIDRKSDGIKSDKRKWALELLSRRTAVSEKNPVHEKEEDSAMLKGNYPLFAQLPKDMRPALEPVRHNKIPTAVRQAQLYRLAEHLLRKANVQAMCPTGETELAIADATNIEREIADRSNSKLVYVNLCSQELLRRSDNATAGRPTETNPSSNSQEHEHADRCEVTNVVSSDMEATEALKIAGLLSDTPPGSPHQANVGIKEDGGFLDKMEEDDVPNNVFEMEPQPEIDIYGDFEYNLEDDFVGAGALEISKPQPQESKMKVVFSTVTADKSDATDVSNHELSVSIETSKVSSELPVSGESLISPIVTSGANETLLQNSAGDEECEELSLAECEELSLAECEELYGPDKEPLVQKYPGTALMNPYEKIASEDIGAGNGNRESSGTVDPQGPPVSENSSSHSQKPEDAQKNESNSVKANKQSDGNKLVRKKVEAYIKEHIRPLCKSGVITVEQYRWTVGKTTEKVMKYHSKDKNANFLIKEGEKVKKLAEQYVESAQQMVKK